ncbi:mandelate racemase/muconate lactonizing enzyme family protein [Microbacterium sp.]|uniref:mandelate racemase/muconate lactonizing enzyme family protein n=1 Tax=Microbacterium sp. TaxID=51671 RepID=UPI003A923428
MTTTEAPEATLANLAGGYGPTLAMHESAKIASVHAIPYAIPYRKPLNFASGSISVADNVVVQVRTSDGVVGTAEALPRPYTYGETQSSIVAAIEDVFAPSIVGLGLFAREQVRARVDRTVGNPSAKAAIDMAIWDAIGRTLDVSVHKLLGGYTDSLTVSHMLGFAAPAQVAAEAVQLYERYGIQSFKIKVGRRPIQDDIAVCRAVREAVGSQAEIYIDGNRGWSAAEASQAISRLGDVGLARVEELCPADDVLSRRWLVQQCSVPFVADESVPTPADVTREILSGAATAVNIKVARTGFSDSLRVANLAEGLGIPSNIGNQIDGHITTACSLAFGASQRVTARHSAELSNYLDLEDSLLTGPLSIEGGEMRVVDGSGLGFEIDESKLEHYRIDNA